MSTTPVSTLDRAYLLDNNGDYIVAPSTGPAQPLVTPNASLASQARHVVARSTGATVVARSSGKDMYTRGGTGPLVAPKAQLVVR